MYLQKLEIQGFKSFADKTTLEFNKELTAIVGPNGSGKSNIADAVRWVLGEQSLKVLRGKKSQDVIFAGSDKKARLGFAEVNLYLNNEDGKAPVDYNEVVITRRIYRDGDGEYLINKNKVRLQDIQMLIAKSSFGQRSYSIVGQGTVESILTSTPQERKEFFDEATGVRQFQIKREQSLNKLEHAFDNLQQSQQLIKEIEPRLKSLTRQMKRLTEREELELELKKIQNNYYSFLKERFSKELDSKKDEFKEIEMTRVEIESKLSDLQKELEKIEAEDGQSKMFNDVQKKYSELINKKNNLLQEISLIQGKIDLNLTAAGQGNIVWLRKKSQELAQQLSIIEENINKLKDEKSKQEILFAGKIKQQEEILIEFGSIKEKLFELRSTGNEDYLSGLKIKLGNLYTKYKIFIEKILKSESLDQLQTLKDEAYSIAEEINELSTNVKYSSLADPKEIQFLEEKLNQFLTSKDNLVDEINKIKIDLEIAKNKSEQLQNQYHSLSDEKVKIDIDLKAQNSESKSEQKDTLLSQKKEHELKLNEVEASLQIVKQQIDNFNNQAESKQENLINIQKRTRELQIELNNESNKINSINVESARLETKLEDLNKEITEELGNQWQPIEMIEGINIEQDRDRINSLKNKLALIGGIDETVPNEYKEVKERFEFLDDQTRDLDKSIDSLQEVIKELDQQISKQFKQNFDIINNEFQKYFSVLFNGGKASLILKQKEESNNENKNNENENQEQEEVVEEINIVKKLKKVLVDTEIDIKACPPGKKIDTINTLSGGEKAMTAIALICAIISSNPSPFVVLDEVDAALDEANAGRYVAILNELSSKTQFIAVTHNRVTMHHASILYGVTMGNDSISRLLSVNLKEAEEKYSK